MGFFEELHRVYFDSLKKNWREIITMENIRFLAEHSALHLSYKMKGIFSFEEIQEMIKVLKEYEDIGFCGSLDIRSHYAKDDELKIGISWGSKTRLNDIGLQIYDLAERDEGVFNDEFFLRYASIGQSQFYYSGKSIKDIEEILKDHGYNPITLEYISLWWGQQEEEEAVQ